MLTKAIRAAPRIASTSIITTAFCSIATTRVLPRIQPGASGSVINSPFASLSSDSAAGAAKTFGAVARPVDPKRAAELALNVELDPHGGFERLPPRDCADKLTIHITDRAGTEHPVTCKVGDNLLFLCRVLQETTPVLYLEGACEASLACSTCHVIIDDDKSFNAFPEATEKEEDMLDQVRTKCIDLT